MHLVGRVIHETAVSDPKRQTNHPLGWGDPQGWHTCCKRLGRLQGFIWLSVFTLLQDPTGAMIAPLKKG